MPDDTLARAAAQPGDRGLAVDGDPGTARGLPGGPLPRLPQGRVRPILIHPDPILRQSCRPAAGMAPSALRTLVADLFATVYAAQGRGLAAPQVGETRRVFVMDAGWKTGASCPRALIDPVLLWQSPEQACDVERCLSIPDRPVAVTRPLAIRVGYLDLDGQPCTVDLSGAEARIALHEMDHLDGRMIIDAPGAGQPDGSGNGGSGNGASGGAATGPMA